MSTGSTVGADYDIGKGATVLNCVTIGDYINVKSNTTVSTDLP